MGIFRDVASAFIPGMSADSGSKRSNSTGSTNEGPNEGSGEGSDDAYGEGYGRKVQRGVKRATKSILSKGNGR